MMQSLRRWRVLAASIALTLCLLPMESTEAAAFLSQAPQKQRAAILAPRFSSAATSNDNTQEIVPLPLKEQLLEPTEVARRVFATDQRPIILFDGVCNLCNSAVNLALDWDPQGSLRFAALQSNVGRALLQVHGRQADDISSIVLVTSNGAYIKSDAILRITEELTPSWVPPFVPVRSAAVAGRYLLPQFVRDLIYDGVADNRYQLMGKQDQCRFDADGEFEDRFVDDRLALE